MKNISPDLYDREEEKVPDRRTLYPKGRRKQAVASLGNY